MSTKHQLQTVDEFQAVVILPNRQRCEFRGNNLDDLQATLRKLGPLTFQSEEENGDQTIYIYHTSLPNTVIGWIGRYQAPQSMSIGNVVDAQMKAA